MNNLPAKTEKKQSRSGYLVATTLQEARTVAEIIASTDFLPSSYKDKTTKKPKINEVIIAGNMGAKHGWDMFESIQAICVINNRPCIWGDYFWALVLSAPEYLKHEEIYSPDVEGGQWTVKIWKKGSDIPIIGVFSLQDASTAGLLSDPNKKHTWGKYPKDMCLWRARSRAGKSGFSHRIKGFSMVEEMRDAVDVTYREIENKQIGNSRTEQIKADLAEKAGKKETPILDRVTDLPEPSPEAVIKGEEMLESEAPEPNPRKERSGKGKLRKKKEDEPDSCAEQRTRIEQMAGQIPAGYERDAIENTAGINPGDLNRIHSIPANKLEDVENALREQLI